MNLFYRNIVFTLLISIGFFVFLHYADALSQNPIFSDPFAVKNFKNIADSVLTLFGLIILIVWVSDARKKIEKEKISFLRALFAVVADLGDEHERRHMAFYESIPKPLKRSLPNGLFWLLFLIVACFGSIFFYVWWAQRHL